MGLAGIQHVVRNAGNLDGSPLLDLGEDNSLEVRRDFAIGHADTPKQVARVDL
jgi:hypothetical protein